MPIRRVAVCVAATGVAGVMVGPIFVGAAAFVIALVAGAAGVLVAWVSSAKRRSPLAAAAITIGGLALTGLVAVGPADLSSLGSEVTGAISSGALLRPPVAFSPGWHALVAWLLGLVGFASGWTAIVGDQPVWAVVVPLPVAAVAAISVPTNAQTAAGVAAVAILGAALLGIANPERRPMGTDGLRTVPAVGIVAAILVAMTHAGLLFPTPRVDPTHRAQLPRAQPLAANANLPLFKVTASTAGPWVLGSLDVYDGAAWRLAPFDQHRLQNVPSSGVVDSTHQAAVKATFTLEQLNGAVLPGLPGLVGVVATGPQLAYDNRVGVLRVAQGALPSGFTYTVVAQAAPSTSTVTASVGAPPPSLAPFTDAPTPPSPVTALLSDAVTTGQGGSAWARFQYLEAALVGHVSVTGIGTPVAVPPSRVVDLLTGSRRGSPWEVAAAEALLARWAGLPARIGYGYQGGDRQADGSLIVRARDAAVFVEVYIDGPGWIPVIGTPPALLPAAGTNPGQQVAAPGAQQAAAFPVVPFIPIAPAPTNPWPRRLGIGLLALLVLALVTIVTVAFWPAVVKARVRGRRRQQSSAAGAEARIVRAYAEWRDDATDFGHAHPGDTPLEFVDRTVPDGAHLELAWLVTRTLWGDLHGQASDEIAAECERLSRDLRHRLAAAHPLPLRAAAAVSRQSLRDPA